MRLNDFLMHRLTKYETQLKMYIFKCVYYFKFTTIFICLLKFTNNLQPLELSVLDPRIKHKISLNVLSMFI